MASTIYYGKSTTLGNERVKRVVIETIPSFQPGDILSVYFTYGNLVDGPTLVITNNDSNQNNAISNDTGLNIYAPGQGAAVVGSWSDGEVVNFSYVKNPSNVFGWELIGKSIATDTIYGGVLLDAESDNSAISKGEAKRLLASTAVGTINYQSRDLGEQASPIGDLTLTTYNPITGETDTQTATVEIPYKNVPTDISYFNNNRGYIEKASAEITNGILFNSENHIYDTLKVGDTNESSTVINLNNNGNLALTPVNGDTIINSGLTVNGIISGKISATQPSTIPNLTVDTINVTANGEGLIVGGNTHLQGNTIIDSLNIGNAPISSYVYDKITDEFLNQAYRIFRADGNRHVKWTWHYAENINLSVGQSNTAVDMGDCGEVGYRTIGIISWEVYNTKYAGQVNLYGFYWGKSETTGLADHLYAKVYNHGPNEIVALKISALVLLFRADPFSIINMPIRFTRIMTEDEQIYEINKLEGIVSSTGELSFNIDNVCDDWDIEGYPTIIYINDIPITGENVDNFMRDIYNTLYEVNYSTRPLNQKVSTIINYNNTNYKFSCYLSNPVACWLRVTTI